MIPRLLLISIITLMTLACGGAQNAGSQDALTLLEGGAFARARAQASSQTPRTPKDQAIIALSLIAQDPSETSAQSALNALRGPDKVASSAAAVQMLELAFVVPKVEDNDFSLLLCETALAAAGYGSMVQIKANPIPGSEVSVNLAVAVLERIYIWVLETKNDLDEDKLVHVWNHCFSLLGGSMACKGEEQAWSLFNSLGKTSAMLWDLRRESNLTKVLMQSTIDVIEQNPNIAIAARCDLSSPFEKLRSILAQDRILLSRLEHTVKDATGCTMGKYAPTKNR